MFSTLFLFLGDIGGAELLLLTLLLLVLILASIWRLLRPFKPTVIVQQPAPTLSVADELHKLQQLREQGVLTVPEFEEQKQRLLR
jgi:hypothetical protein